MSINTNLNTAGALQGQSTNFLPTLWAQGCIKGHEMENFFGQFEGKSSRSPIMAKQDLAKGGGQVMVFRTEEGLYEDGVRGDELINNDGESWEVGDFTLRVDFVRHSTKWNLRTEEQTGLGYEIKSGKNVALGKWMGRKKTSDMMMALLHTGNSDNYSVINGKGNIESLRSSDTLSMDAMLSTGQQLKTLGGMPAQIGKDQNGNPIDSYIYVSLGEALVQLKQSSDYKQAQRDGGVRGNGNVIFKGGYTNIDGHSIVEFNPIDHAGKGAIGSALNPRAKLGDPIAADTVAQDITGGGDARKAANARSMYFEFFSNYGYRFGTVSGQALTPTTSTRYCLIINQTGTDAGKMGFYSFTTNDGNKLTMTGRLRAAASGIAVTTLGNVTWNTGVWGAQPGFPSGLHTDSHPSGSLIIETNSYGVPFTHSLALGANAAVRGYGKFQNRRYVDDTKDGGFLRELYIMSVFGQAPYRRSDGVAPNFKVLTHAIEYQGLNIPTNIT